MNIGIFGGAFDPFHTEHKNIIVMAQRELKLDKVIVVPSYFPPHKSYAMSSYECRRAMVAKSVEDLSYVVIDDIERERAVVNPTNEILHIIKQKYPCKHLYFIIGGDSMIHFHTWIKPERICEKAVLAVVSRDGYQALDDSIEYAKNDFNARIVKLRYNGKEVSSSVIKASLELGLDTVSISKEVLAIIEENGLYKQFNDIVVKAKSEIPKDTYTHVCNTVLYGLKLNAQLNLPYDKVFLACLLHDCAKHIHKIMVDVPDKVVHQFLGAEVAKEDYGIEDCDILDAITYHTTGKKEMSPLGMLVYCADMLEKDRDYEGVETLRQIIEEDFETGFIACINKSIEKLNKENNPIHPLTKECLAYYNNKEEN